ncbi:metal-dependent hydrolase family protein [Lacticaseibacillus thailandensis]|uniref:metal-dependent hydrolase family protein n=1 Tax=Lacticaseibacillus thailandensis TaxID=381741 RepID=UPI0009EB2106|nr:amidohydrolase family protein [Lacticaseibacillus thailandensis]
MATTAYVHVNLFNGQDDGFIPNSWLVVDNTTGRVTATGHGPTPNTDQVVDVADKFIMPGMINTHVHVDADANHTMDGPITETEVTLMALANLRQALQAGVTYVRNLGTGHDVDIKLRDAQQRYHFPAPGIVASGRLISSTGGNGDGPYHERNASYIVDSPDEMRRVVRQIIKNGADVVKVLVTGGVMSKGDDPRDVGFSAEELAVAVSEAHARRRKAVAHAQGTTGIQMALDAGFDSIEHGIYLNAEEARVMSERGVYLVPTLNAVESIVRDGRGHIPDYMVDKATTLSNAFFDNMRQAVALGVPMTTGTDAGTTFNDFGTGYWDELHLMVHKIGVSPQQTLYNATINGARLLGIDQDYGTLTVGKFADFIVLSASR